MASLDLIGIHKSFDAARILHDISISIVDGEFLVLVGPSGCGKSTLMNIIAGLDEPDSGSLRLDGRDIACVDPADRDIAMVFQSYALYPSMTVAENIEFPLRMRKVAKETRIDRVNAVAALLQIGPLMDRRPRDLSGGQRQRVAIGRALVREPKLYLFDEPLSNLDAQLRLEMRTEIKKLHQRLKATIVYVTHDQIEAMTLATRIAVMKGGVVQQLGTPSEVYNRPANTFVAGFMGSPRMNLVPARVAGRVGALALTMQRGDRPEVHMDLAALPTALDAHLGRDVIVGIRAEAIALARAGLAPGPLQRAVSARVDVMEPTGAETLTVINLAGHELTARLEADAPVVVGQEALFWVDLSKVVFFDTQTQALIA